MNGLSATALATVPMRHGAPAPQGPPGALLLRQGRYLARLAASPEDLDAAQALRHRCFFGPGRAAPRPDARDRDALDEACLHLLVEDAGPPGQKDRAGGADPGPDRATAQAGGGAAETPGPAPLAACCRLMPFADGRDALRGYAARHYDLAGLAASGGPLTEIGRFCVRPGLRDTDVLRVAWGALARLVDAQGVAMLFGCTSFAGNDAAPYLDALALLRDRHLGPAALRPGVGAAEILRFSDLPGGTDPRRGLAQLPPLLRSYLAMGGWVGDHAVIDREMNTLHVFTAVEIAAIPATRARVLRALAEGAQGGRVNGP